LIDVRALTDRRDVARALRRLLPEAYRGVAGWHAPPMAFHLARLDPAQEPIWREAERVHLVAERDGRPVGRLVAFVPPEAARAPPGTRTGRFALFEAIDDDEVSRALVAAASRWLAERGCTAVEGPFAFSIHDEVGLLVDGFEDPPAFLMPFNPPHAERHLLRLGFTPTRTFFSAAWELRRDGVPVRPDRKDLAAPDGLALRPFSLARRAEDTAAIVEVYNAAFEGNWGFERLSLDAARTLVDQFIRFGDPRIVRVAELEGRLAAFALIVPDPNAQLHATRGQPDWLRLLRLAGAVKLRRLRKLRFITLAVRPEARGRGIAHALIRDAARVCVALGYRTAELSYVDGDNAAMGGILDGLSLPRTKRYATFRRALP
jgi:GNAT superfamily N-acetyltransferase